MSGSRGEVNQEALDAYEVGEALAVRDGERLSREAHLVHLVGLGGDETGAEVVEDVVVREGAVVQREG